MKNSSRHELVVVSAHGRGNWVAMELAARGWKVLLSDVTEQLGPIALEDVEGPFGLLEAPDLLSSQRSRLSDEGELETVPNGFTIWLPDGPLELHSPVTPHLLDARGIPEEVESYLRHASPAAPATDRERRAILKMVYDRNWLAQLAHGLHSVVHKQNHVAIEAGVPSPLFSPYSIRQISEYGPPRGLKHCQTVGVHLRPKSEIGSVRMTGKLVDFIEFKDEHPEETRAVMWCLSPHETKRVSESAYLTLFPFGAPAPQWSWERLRFRFDPKNFETSLPHWTVVLYDRDLSWTRANLAIVRRQAESEFLDAWVKVPTWMRSERAAFETIRRELEAVLRSRLPGANLQPVLAEFAPLSWPVYDPEELDGLKIVKSSNLFFSAPEFWSGLDWLERFRHEQSLVARLEKLKAQWDAADAKAAARAAAKARKDERKRADRNRRNEASP